MLAPDSLRARGGSVGSRLGRCVGSGRRDRGHRRHPDRGGVAREARQPVRKTEQAERDAAQARLVTAEPDYNIEFRPVLITLSVLNGSQSPIFDVKIAEFCHVDRPDLRWDVDIRIYGGEPIEARVLAAGEWLHVPVRFVDPDREPVSPPSSSATWRRWNSPTPTGCAGAAATVAHRFESSRRRPEGAAERRPPSVEHAVQRSPAVGAPRRQGGRTQGEVRALPAEAKINRRYAGCHTRSQARSTPTCASSTTDGGARRCSGGYGPTCGPTTSPVQLASPPSTVSSSETSAVQLLAPGGVSGV